MGLTFTNGQYSYTWKTSKGWAGTCRQFQLQLIDGTLHTATFMFIEPRTFRLGERLRPLPQLGFAAVAVPEARIEQTDQGAVVASPGWFVVNMADCAWTRDDKGGEWSTYGEPEGEFQQYGIGIHVLHPGPGERPLPLGERAGGLPRPLRRVPAADRGGGAAPEGLGLHPLRARARGTSASAPATGRARS